MPPKADVGVAAGNVTDNDAIALCRMMAHADEFRVNHAKLAPYLNINHGKNVYVSILLLTFHEHLPSPALAKSMVLSTNSASTTRKAR